MLIQKTLHLPLSLKAAKARISDFSSYRHQCVGLEEGEIDPASAEGLFRFRVRGGVRLCVELALVDGEIDSQTLFRSTKGNIVVVGMLEYFAREPDTTEVVLTLDYVIRSPWQRWVDRLTRGVEAFVDRNIKALEAFFALPPAGFRADTHLVRPINGNALPDPEAGA